MIPISHPVWGWKVAVQVYAVGVDACINVPAASDSIRIHIGNYIKGRAARYDFGMLAYIHHQFVRQINRVALVAAVDPRHDEILDFALSKGIYVNRAF